jgi:hypothetical protein
MANLGNTTRPAYVYDAETDTWLPIGVGAHSHDYTSQFIGKTLVDAKGDIVTASANDVPAILSKGADGTVLVADSTTSTGLAWQPYGAIQVAGKNKFINGDFSIWQRGTSFTNPGDNTYNCDRYRANGNGTGVTKIISRQAFTPGTAPVAGYEAQYFYRFAQTVAGTGATYNNGIQQPIEDVRTFAGQTVTWSFWAKADSTRTVYPNVERFYGSGGTGYEYINLPGVVITTSWTRHSITFTVPSIASKTLGAGSYFMPYIGFDANTVQTFDFWGWQIEAGPIATPFTTATGTIQGELAACQRYYYRWTSGATYARYPTLGVASSTTIGSFPAAIPVTMRTTPYSVEYGGNFRLYDMVNTPPNMTSIVLVGTTELSPTGWINIIVASGLTQLRTYSLNSRDDVNAYIGLNAEL